MKTNVRVVIPRNAAKLILLITTILNKHKEDGENSPLSVLETEQLEKLLEKAIKEDASAQKLKRDAEAAVQKRNLVLGTAKGQGRKTPATLTYFATSTRDLLLGIYRGKERELGQWGFEVNDSLSGDPVPGTDPPPPAT